MWIEMVEDVVVEYKLTYPQNNKALAQIPYNGKKTVPAAIRKDMWLPFAKIEFPEAHAQTGLDAFRILREYRKLHETQWDPSFTLDKDGKPLSKKMRGRKLCDQRANSIADMAATLTKLSTVRRQAGPAGKRGQKGVAPVFEEHTVRATVRWANLHDAEYAEMWPETVVHDTLESTKNNRRVIQELEEPALDMDGEVALA